MNKWAITASVAAGIVFLALASRQRGRIHHGCFRRSTGES